MCRLPAFAADGSLDVASLKSTSRLACLSGVSSLAGKTVSYLSMRRSACGAAAGRAGGIGQKPAQGACARYVRPIQWTCHAQIARICCGRISGCSKSEKHQQTGLFKRRKQPGRQDCQLFVHPAVSLWGCCRPRKRHRAEARAGSLCTLCEANPVDLPCADCPHLLRTDLWT